MSGMRLSMLLHVFASLVLDASGMPRSLRAHESLHRQIPGFDPDGDSSTKLAEDIRKEEDKVRLLESKVAKTETAILSDDAKIKQVEERLKKVDASYGDLQTALKEDTDPQIAKAEKEVKAAESRLDKTKIAVLREERKVEKDEEALNKTMAETEAAKEADRTARAAVGEAEKLAEERERELHETESILHQQDENLTAAEKQKQASEEKLARDTAYMKNEEEALSKVKAGAQKDFRAADLQFEDNKAQLQKKRSEAILAEQTVEKKLRIKEKALEELQERHGFEGHSRYTHNGEKPTPATIEYDWAW